MNKKEEKLFDKNFCMEDYDIDFSDMKDIKNWITEHDKRERERLIEDIEKDINYFYLFQDEAINRWADNNILNETKKLIYQMRSRVKEIINKYK